MEEKFVRNLIAELALSSERIADIAGVTVEFVENVKAKITAEK